MRFPVAALFGWLQGNQVRQPPPPSCGGWCLFDPSCGWNTSFGLIRSRAGFITLTVSLAHWQATWMGVVATPQLAPDTLRMKHLLAGASDMHAALLLLSALHACLDYGRHSRPGILTMANTGRDTNTSVFCITVKSLPHLGMQVNHWVLKASFFYPGFMCFAGRFGQMVATSPLARYSLGSTSSTRLRNSFTLMGSLYKMS